MNAVEVGLYNKLAAYSSLTAALSAATAIYNQVAAPSALLPYCVFGYAGGGLENINPSELHNLVYMVKAIADDSAEASTLQGHIKGALHLQTLTVSGYINFWMACEDEINFVEQVREGVTYYHRGYYVRIRIDN